MLQNEAKNHFLCWYIPSEKIGQIFDPPEMAFLALIIIIGLEGMHFGHFWLPRTPGGVKGGMGGSRGPKIVTFLGATFGLQIGKFWIV